MAFEDVTFLVFIQFFRWTYLFHWFVCALWLCMCQCVVGVGGGEGWLSCVRACVRACVRVCVRACLNFRMHL